MTTYKDAGVDVEAGDEAVRRIGPLVAQTFSASVLEGLGGFGSLFRFDAAQYTDPILVSSTDGVGTKTQVARALGEFSSLGGDLLAMCVDDLACVGATPLFFLDYLAVGHQSPSRIEEIVGGIAEACRYAQVALIGGETAEHPGVMDADDLDLAGFVVGVVDREEMWTPAKVREGDALVGLVSPNLRANGFSLIRSIYADLLLRAGASQLRDDDLALLRRLIEPSVIYSPVLQQISHRTQVHAAAHITGGGLLANLSRAIPEGLVGVVEHDAWEVPDIFRVIQRDGSVPTEEMWTTFNMGVGMVLVVEASVASDIVVDLGQHGVRSMVVGRVVRGEGRTKVRAQWS